MMAKGENIFKRKDGRWEARYIKGYELSGKIKYGFCYGKSYREAKEKVTQCKAALVSGEPESGADHRRRVPRLRPSAPRRLPEARERDLTGLHAGLLRPRCRSGQGRTPRRRAVCLFRRHRLGAGASGHRGSARRVPAPRRGRRRPGLHAALPRLCPEQLHLQLVGAVPCPRPR
mgnify:CR=1 FL=1